MKTIKFYLSVIFFLSFSASLFAYTITITDEDGDGIFRVGETLTFTTDYNVSAGFGWYVDELNSYIVSARKL